MLALRTLVQSASRATAHVHAPIVSFDRAPNFKPNTARAVRESGNLRYHRTSSGGSPGSGKTLCRVAAASRMIGPLGHSTRSVPAVPITRGYLRCRRAHLSNPRASLRMPGESDDRSRLHVVILQRGTADLGGGGVVCAIARTCIEFSRFKLPPTSKAWCGSTGRRSNA